MMFSNSLLPMRGSILALTLLCIISTTLATTTQRPACKDECNKNFNGDALIEHPGVQTICHRGCELFTVAFIATPRGGVPLVGPKPGVIPPAIMATLDEYGIPLGPANFPIEKKKNVSHQKPQNLKPVAVEIKNKKEIEALERSFSKKIDAEHERMNVKRLLSGGEEPKKMKKIDAKQVDSKPPSETIKSKKPNPQLIKIEDVFDFEDCPELSEAEKESFKKQMKINEVHVAPDRVTEKEGSDKVVTKDEKHQLKGKSKNSFSQRVYSKTKKDPKEKTVHASHSEKTFTGEKARIILNQARESHKISHVKSDGASSNVPHGPEKIAKPVSKEDKNAQNPSSKTTVQPLPHPVQDHPVHANRQITTDSSSANDRKTTTPKSSNPAAPASLGKINQIHMVNDLAAQLGTNKNKLIHPLLHITLMKQKPVVEFMVPQQVSIIEIVKKKNNIDFEKLHQEHMNGAAMCPQINERLEQAKHSCRHACMTAFSISKEQDACFVGCHIRASSSVKQVEEQKSQTANNRPPLFAPENSILLGKDGLFSTVSKMFSSLAQNIGQSVRTSLGTLNENRDIQPKDGPSMPNSPQNRLGDHMNALDMGSVEKSGSISTDGQGHQIINSRTVVHMNSPNKLQHRTEVNIVQSNEFEPFVQNSDMNDNIFQHTLEEFGNRHKQVDLLNKEIEIMGFHLNEKPKESAQHQIPKFIKDIMFGRGFEPMTMGKLFGGKQDSQATNNKIHAPTSFKTVMTSEIRDSEATDELKLAKPDFEKFSGFVDPKDFVRSDPINGKQDSMITVQQLQQLDLLECISRKSGLPRWLIGMTIFASALLVVWLCFSLYSPVEESKLCKKKQIPPTIVLCDGDDLHGCSEEKSLLPQDECVKIHFQNV